MKIVLNAILVKQKGTGGYNVALNFFNKTLEDKENEWFYFVSQEFDLDIKDRGLLLDKNHYFVFHSQPNLRFYFKDRTHIRKAESKIKPDVIYSILAPSYHTFKSIEVMRCANAWAVAGGVNKYALKVTPFKLKVIYFTKAITTRLMMRNTKYFITQSEIAKECILRTVPTSPENVCVVSNVLPEKYQKVVFHKIEHTGFNMIYVAATGVHKDYLILPQLASILVKKYGMKSFKIHITIPINDRNVRPRFEKEMKKYAVEDYFINHGLIKQEDLINIYPQCDLGLFPSLLETFSVTLLEYMYFKLPIVASDLDFNKEVADNAAIYFVPHNADDFADKIFLVYNNTGLRESLVKNARNRLAFYSNNQDKYCETVGFLKKCF